MPYTSRVLPPDEWPRLVGTEIGPVWDHLPPTTTVVVVEDGEEIVGAWCLLPLWHVEGLWIAEAHRRAAGVGRRLLTGMLRAAHEAGAHHVQTAALTDDVRGMITKLGGIRTPGDPYTIPVGGSRCHSQQSA